MSYNRKQLNALIFENRAVLPRTSAGFGDVSLAVAELQGGNLTKAAMFAETAVAKDPVLAAGWLAKAAADVFAASGTDLRTERAVFCLERAMDSAPTCRKQMVEFFVTNILRHYVTLLTSAARAEVGRWMEAESQAARARHEAALFSALGLSAAMTAFFSKRWGLKLVSGAASFLAYAESTRRAREAQMLRVVASGHRSASFLHLVPARELVWLAAQMLRVEGLRVQKIEPMAQDFLEAFYQVFGLHLQWLKGQLELPMLGYLLNHKGMLFRTYFNGGPTDSLHDQAWRNGFMGYPHPSSAATLICLGQILPQVTETERYQLLAFPIPYLTQFQSGNEHRPAAYKSTDLDRLKYPVPDPSAALPVRPSGMGGHYLISIILVGLLEWSLPDPEIAERFALVLFITPFLLVYLLIANRVDKAREARFVRDQAKMLQKSKDAALRREQLRPQEELIRSLWSVDSWVNPQAREQMKAHLVS